LTSDLLFHRERSCLVVVDVQEYFVAKLPLDQRAPLVARIAWLMRVARALNIPIIATAEDIAEDGPLVPELAALLPTGQAVFDKRVFGLHDQADIRAAVIASKRREFVVVGLETDVCIAHSAMGLAGAGYRVAVLEDGCGSPPPNHEAGLRRLRDAGIMVTTIKGMHYEWVRDLSTLAELKAAIGNDCPTDLTL
jgi:nicotinamidase-related amidase